MLRNFVQLYKKIPLWNVSSRFYKYNRVVINNAINKKSLFLINIGVFINKTFMQNFDVNLQKACDNGEESIVDFMNALKNDLVKLSVIYLECLKKQIQIMEENMDIDPFSQRWDDLTEYRVFANELNDDFTDFVTILNTLKQMVNDGNLRMITEDENYLQIISDGVNELDKIVAYQTVKIKQFEKQLLDCHQQNILRT